MPTHHRRVVDPSLPLTLQTLYNEPRQQHLPGTARVVKTPGQTGTVHERPTTPAPPPDQRPTKRPPAV